MVAAAWVTKGATMASENDLTTPEQAPVEKPKRRRATKKAAAAAPSESGAAPLEPGPPAPAVAIEFEADAVPRTSHFGPLVHFAPVTEVVSGAMMFTATSRRRPPSP